MEEATGAPNSITVWAPKRLRASGRDGETVMTEPPSPLRMLLSRHTRRREFITSLGGGGVAAHQNKHRPREVNHATEYLSPRLRQTARGRCSTPCLATGVELPG